MELNKLKFTKHRLDILNTLEINTVEDILRYYPSRYEKYELTPLNSVKNGDDVVFKGEIIKAVSTFRKGKMTISHTSILVDGEEVKLVIYNRPYARMLKLEDELIVIGKMDNNSVIVKSYSTKDEDKVLGIQSVYPLKANIKQNEIKAIIEFVFKNIKEYKDLINEELLNKHHLISYDEAIHNIHKPENVDMLKKALSRLKYEEFLKYYLSFLINKDVNSNLKKAKNFDVDKVNALVKSLSFNLTKDQNSAIQDILNDLRSNKQMYRLLEGDVGSGKTVVSLIALYANYLSGYQGTLMAPTEILAKQHYEEYKTMLEPLGVRVELLYASSKDKNDIKERLANNEIDILIGTHALFTEDVTFNNLGFIITDELQRFGVKQRQKLKDKGENCDFLLMSATPIPRTLASAIYGDMDISIIETMPVGRKGCDTYLIKENSIRSIIKEIKETLDKGEQIYIIASSIEQNDNDTKAAIELYSHIKELFKEHNVGLMHGRLKANEKIEVMNDFEDHNIDILVSTTVVEVGVNVKNATMMIIYDSDRFGLSQLHQLRGRVQRSNKRGTCYLLSKTKEEDTLKRLEVLTKSNDGFYISNEDLKLRGPGDILGTRQSGLPSLILGDFFKDSKIIEAAKKDAAWIIDNKEMNLAIIREVTNKKRGD